ncbi:glycosyltransferase [Paenibacillus sp. FSL K6-0276]|uniref:glycosyltransferase n=1 Tax=Paenibacillus sp. FSL K6-0276 TaxID=2921450 RepID=UPI0030EB14FD
MKRTNPKVSIIIPSYNHSKFIGEAIDSILSQTYSDFELLIIDDASPDNSVEVIKKYNDPRIRFYGFEKNQGAVDTLNYGIINSSSDYIALLNSDDYWEIDKLEKQVLYLQEHNEVDCVFSDANFIDETGKVLSKTDYFWADAFTQINKSSGHWLNQLFFKLNCFCHPSMLIKKGVYNEVGLYNPSLRQLPDFSMWINVIKKFNIHVMEEKLVNFRILSNEMNTSSVTYENRIRNKNELFVIMSSFFDEMKDEDFVEGFLDGRGSVYTKEEIECEKAFAYLKEISPDIKPIYVLIGLRKLSELLNSENTRDVLREKYGFSANDYFKYTGKLDIIDVFETSFHQVVVESAKRKIQKDTNLYSTIRKFFKK